MQSQAEYDVEGTIAFVEAKENGQAFPHDLFQPDYYGDLNDWELKSFGIGSTPILSEELAKHEAERIRVSIEKELEQRKQAEIIAKSYLGKYYPAPRKLILHPVVQAVKEARPNAVLPKFPFRLVPRVADLTAVVCGACHSVSPKGGNHLKWFDDHVNERHRNLFYVTIERIES